MYTRVNTHGQAPLPQPVEGGPASGPGPHKAFRLFLVSGPREAQGGGPPAKPSSEGANPPASGVRWGRRRLREGAQGGAGQHRGAHGSESWCARSGRGRLQSFQKPGGGRISNETPPPHPLPQSFRRPLPSALLPSAPRPGAPSDVSKETCPRATITPGSGGRRAMKRPPAIKGRVWCSQGRSPAAWAPGGACLRPPTALSLREATTLSRAAPPAESLRCH